MQQNLIRFIQCVLVGTCLYSPLVLPVAVGGLYEAVVEVEDRSQSARQRGFALAMDIVLVKLTGNMAAAQDPDLAPLLDNSSAYVQKFGYDDEGLLLVGFDGTAIENQLVGLGKAIWGRERPVTLVWLAIDDGKGERKLIGANDNDPVIAAMQEVAERRGIPLIFPLLDAQDTSEVEFIDVWGGFDQKLQLASARYDADAILVGRVRREANAGNDPGNGYVPDADQGWARWILLYQAQTEHWRGNLAAGVNRTTDFYASLFAASTEYAGQLTMLVVDGISDFKSYARVSKYLESLSAVNDVNIDRVENDRVYYRLALRTDVTGLQRAIGLGHTLEMPGFDEDTPDAIPGAGLYYRLRQ